MNEWDSVSTPVVEDDWDSVSKPMDKPVFDLSDTLESGYHAFKDLGTTVPAAFSRMTEGLKRPDQYSETARKRFAAEEELLAQRKAERDAKILAGDTSSVSEAIEQGGQSLGFGVNTLLPTIAGAATGTAVGGLPGTIIGGTIGATGSGAAAYRMAGNQFLQDAFQQLEQKSLRDTGAPMSEEAKADAYRQLLPIAQNTGLWEAGPEAIGNLALAGAGKIILGFGKKGLQNLATKALGKIGSKVAAGAAGVGTELATEAVTQQHQAPDQQKMQSFVDTGAIPDLPIQGFMQSLKEVAPATFGQMALMGLAGGGIHLGSKALGSQQQTQTAIPQGTDIENLTDQQVMNMVSDVAPVSAQVAASTPAPAVEEEGPEITFASNPDGSVQAVFPSHQDAQDFAEEHKEDIQNHSIITENGVTTLRIQPKGEEAPVAETPPVRTELDSGEALPPEGIPTPPETPSVPEGSQTSESPVESIEVFHVGEDQPKFENERTAWFTDSNETAKVYQDPNHPLHFGRRSERGTQSITPASVSGKFLDVSSQNWIDTLSRKASELLTNPRHDRGGYWFNTPRGERYSNGSEESARLKLARQIAKEAVDFTEEGEAININDWPLIESSGFSGVKTKSETGGMNYAVRNPKQISITSPTQPTDALQEPTAEKVLPRQQGEVGATGSERVGMGQGEQGKETPAEGLQPREGTPQDSQNVLKSEELRSEHKRFEADVRKRQQQGLLEKDQADSEIIGHRQETEAKIRQLAQPEQRPSPATPALEAKGGREEVSPPASRETPSPARPSGEVVDQPSVAEKPAESIPQSEALSEAQSSEPKFAKTGEKPKKKKLSELVQAPFVLSKKGRENLREEGRVAGEELESTPKTDAEVIADIKKKSADNPDFAKNRMERILERPEEIKDNDNDVAAFRFQELEKANDALYSELSDRMPKKEREKILSKIAKNEEEQSKALQVSQMVLSRFGRGLRTGRKIFGEDYSVEGLTKKLEASAGRKLNAEDQKFIDKLRAKNQKLKEKNAKLRKQLMVESIKNLRKFYERAIPLIQAGRVVPENIPAPQGRGLSIENVRNFLAEKGFTEGPLIKVGNYGKSRDGKNWSMQVRDGKLYINAAQIESQEDFNRTIEHELSHLASEYEDVKKHYTLLKNSLTTAQKAQVAEWVNRRDADNTPLYSDAERQDEEIAETLRILNDLGKTKVSKPKLEAFVQSVKKFFHKLTGIWLGQVDAQLLAADALHRAETKLKGETSQTSEGKFAKVPDKLSEQDSAYLAAVERGDMETAQRMVDEAAPKFELKWRKRNAGGWVSENGVWSIRGPIMAKPMFWLLKGNSRYTPTGKYDDVVNFKTADEAKKFAESLAKPKLDPITRDESGKVIPLSQLFKSESPDIRFSKVPEQPQPESSKPLTDEQFSAQEEAKLRGEMELDKVVDSALSLATMRDKNKSLEDFQKDVFQLVRSNDRFKELSDSDIESAINEVADRRLQTRSGLERKIAQAESANNQPGVQERAIKRNESIIRALRKRIADGKFIKETPEFRRLSDEEWEQKLEKDRLRKELNTGILERRLKNRPLLQKIIGFGQELLNASRTIITSMDLSAVLNQGGFVAFGNPGRALKNIMPMLRAFGSEENRQRIYSEIQKRPNSRNGNYERFGLAISNPNDPSMSALEENYMSRLIAAPKKTAVGRVITAPFRASERAFSSFLNLLRADSFDAMSASYFPDGNITQQAGEALANYINVATGKGKIGWGSKAVQGNAAVGLNSFLFAPRWIASRINLLAGQPFYGGTATTRKAVLNEYVKFLTGAAVVYGLASLATDDDGNPAEIETDPRSSDFSKIKLGESRINPLGGLTSVATLIAREVSGETKSLSGNISSIRGEDVPYKGDTGASVLGRFLRTKLSPALSAAVDVMSGQDVVGQPTDLESEMLDMVKPISMRDIARGVEDQGVPRGTAMALLNLLGMNLQVHDKK